MIDLPNFNDAWQHENAFYQTCDITRISKLLAQYELFKMTLDIPGAIVECGVCKGASLSRFASFRELFCNPIAKKIIAFDTFDKFPEALSEIDKKFHKDWVENVGESISVEQMEQVLEHKGCSRHVKLVPGDINQTVPAYVERNPQLKISLLNLDTDIYEPAVTILELLYPRVERGGVVLLDDYGAIPGATKAIDEYFQNKPVQIRKFPFAMSPCYLVKE